MTGIKISALPPIVTAQLTDIFPVVQGGITQKETVQQLVTLIDSPSVLTGFLPLSGGTMLGNLFLNMDPILPFQAATKEYVDTVASGFTVILACLCASTADQGAIYANGIAGVGATLTDNSGTFVAYSTDGVSPALTNRVLIKDQTNPVENGIYELTTNGDGISVPWVLTRTTDYDLAPAQIHPGTLVAVNSGTINATTSWLETATVTNIGADPILFSQFTFGPASFLLKANNLSDVNSVAASLVNLGLGVPTGTGNVVRQTSPTLVTPILGAATATSLTFNPTTNGIVGTPTNNNASAGFVGEFISSVVVAGSVNLVNNIAVNITSIILSAGDWNIEGNACFAFGGVTGTTFVCWLSTISATLPNASLYNGIAGINLTSTNGGFQTPFLRLSLAAPTTVYLSAFGQFTAGTPKAGGGIYARRVR